jgi:hypothetical protein
MSRVASVRILVVILGLLAAACGGEEPSVDVSATTGASEAPMPATGAPPWPAPPDPLELTAEAGLEPTVKEFFAVHSHAHLDVFVNGEPVEVPPGIGINIDDPGVKHFENPTSYGGIELCDAPCISPLHTHDASGILHTEAPENRSNTLGEFFVEWDVQLDENCVGGYCEPDAPIAVYVDGEPYDGDPAAIALEDQREIAIVIGTPPEEIPATYDFSNA